MPSKNPNYLGKVRSSVSKYLFYVPMVLSPDATVTAKTADATLTTSDLNTILTNSGASGTVVLTLPAANTCREGMIRFTCLAAQILRVDPSGTEKIYLNGSGVAGKYLNIAAVIGNYAEIYCDGTNWYVTTYSGVVTKEA